MTHLNQILPTTLPQIYGDQLGEFRRKLHTLSETQ